MEHPPHSEYTATVWQEAHHYRLAEGRIEYRFGDSGATYTVALEPGRFILRPRLQTHRFFRVGLVLVAFPLITLGMIYAKEHSISGLGAMLYVQFVFFAAGLALVARFRQIYRAYLLRTESGDALLIYRDPDQSERADALIDQLKALALEPERPAE